MDEPIEAPLEEAVSMEELDLDKLSPEQLKGIIYRQHDALEQISAAPGKESCEFIELNIEGIGLFKINSPAAVDSIELIDKVVSVIKELNLNKRLPVTNGTMI